MKAFVKFFLLLSFLLFLGNGLFSATDTSVELRVSKRPKWEAKKPQLKLEYTIGSEESEEESDTFGAIHDFAFDPDGNLYILDFKAFSISTFDRTGKFQTRIQLKRGQGPGEFAEPKRMAVDENGSIYISDIGTRRITLIDGNGDLVRVIRIEDKVAPLNMKLFQGKTMFFNGILDLGNEKIYRFNLESGKIERKFCEKAKFDRETVMAGVLGDFVLDRESNLIFSFPYPYEIRKFDGEGTLISRFTRKCGYFDAPPKKNSFGATIIPALSRSVGLLSDGSIINYVSYRGNEKSKPVQLFDVFSKEGEWLYSFDSGALLTNDRIYEIRTDPKGFLYVYFLTPYPRISKYSLAFD